MSKKDSLYLTAEEIEDYLPLMFLQIKDEDLEKAEKDYGQIENFKKVLRIMLSTPKEQWKEKGIPDYLMKYEIADEEDEDW